MQKASDSIIVNDMKFSCPEPGMQIMHSQTLYASRNANNAVVGQKVGRKLWKINNLQENGLDAQTWSEMKAALEPFYPPVTEKQ